MWDDLYFPRQLLRVQFEPWYDDNANYLVTGEVPLGWRKHDKDRFFYHVKIFYWDDPFLFKYYSYKILSDVSLAMRLEVSSFMTKLVGPF